MSTTKKKILWQSNYPKLWTGLGKNTKYVLDYLYRTGKFDITLYAMGLPYEHPDFARFPYKVIGSLPMNQQELDRINANEPYRRACSYGAFYIDKVIKETKADVWIGSDDWWAFGKSYIEKPWFDKINSIFHITLDSIPLIKEAVELAPRVKHFYCWTDFATKEMHRLGHKHVKTLTGCISEKDFFRFDENKRKELRRRFSLPEDAFIIGMDSRNQLRKEFPALLEGFSMFLRQNPTIKNAFLFLITTHNEGWSIPRYLKEFKIPKQNFLALYLCRACQKTQVRMLEGQDLDCKFCKSKRSQQTIRIDFGCSEEQLNECYNLFDGVCHVMNAGGLELGMVQALYAELPLATVPYASGLTFVGQPFISTIDCAWTRQIGTEFKRACPYPSSIAKYIKKLYQMDKLKRLELGRKGRNWAISQFSPSVVGKQWEELIDSMPSIDYDYNIQYKVKNDNYPYKGDKFTNDSDFIIDLYQNILFLERENHPEADGVKNWLGVIRNGGKKEDIYREFIKVAHEDNSKNVPIKFETFFDEDRPNKRGLIVCKESRGDVFYVTSLLQSFKIQYPDMDLYFCTEPQYFEMLAGNPYIHKVIPWCPAFEQEMLVIGAGQDKSLVHVFMLPAIGTQRQLNYLSHTNIAHQLMDYKLMPTGE